MLRWMCQGQLNTHIVKLPLRKRKKKTTTGCDKGFGECLEGEVNQMSVCVKFGYVAWKWMCDGFRPYLLAMLWYAAHVEWHSAFIQAKMVPKVVL